MWDKEFTEKRIKEQEQYFKELDKRFNLFDKDQHNRYWELKCSALWIHFRLLQRLENINKLNR
jgi:hypothetical protein